MDVPDYVATRIRQPIPQGLHVVRDSTPVVAFGDFYESKVCTLGLNPSRQEFLSTSGELLTGEQRRLASTRSLGLRSLAEASDAQVAEVVNDCRTYFRRRPYKKWFDQLDRVLKIATGTSYYDETACHLDLVQWATDPVWGQIKSKAVREALLEADKGFLKAQLEREHLEVVLINGSGVMNAVRSAYNIEFEPRAAAHAGDKSSAISVAHAFGTKFIGWSTNLQSAFGVTSALKATIADRVAEEVYG